MLSPRHAPQRVYDEAYDYAREHGANEDAARWHAEVVLQAMRELPELPHKEPNDETQR